MLPASHTQYYEVRIKRQLKHGGSGKLMENLEESKDHEKAEPEKNEDNSEEKSKAYNEQQKPEEKKATSESIMAPQFSPPGEFSFKPKDWTLGYRDSTDTEEQ